MLEAHGSADQAGERTQPVACVVDAAAVLPQHFVALADLFARQIEELRADDARRARQPMTVAARHDSEQPGTQQPRLPRCDLDPALARGDDVEHPAVLDRR
jgi:hypothetical protein